MKFSNKNKCNTDAYVHSSSLKVIQSELFCQGEVMNQNVSVHHNIEIIFICRSIGKELYDYIVYVLSIKQITPTEGFVYLAGNDQWLKLRGNLLRDQDKKLAMMMAGHVFEVQIHVQCTCNQVHIFFEWQNVQNSISVKIYCSGTRRIRDYVIDHLPAQQSLGRNAECYRGENIKYLIKRCIIKAYTLFLVPQILGS